MKTDIIIIGGGLAGSASAVVLANAGYAVALIDTRAEFPPEFRAEKLGQEQMTILERLGLSERVGPALAPNEHVKVARFGRMVAERSEREYGFRYADLVNSLRNHLPDNATFVLGRVVDVATSVDRQVVTINDGRTIEGRLLIVSTGLGDTIKSKLGIERTIFSSTHSLSFGFSLVAPPSAFPFESLVYYGNGPSDRISYVTIFRTPDGMRANLFVYRNVTDDWSKRFRAAPEAMMIQCMPGLSSICPDLRVEGTVAVRPVDLSVASRHERDGVVLVGDAFGTCCPIIGMGIMKVLTDVEQLCTVHLPVWFESPGMGADKLASYYQDETKRACDAKAKASSLYSRSIATSPSFVWSARRIRNVTVRRGIYALQGATKRLLKLG